MPSPRLPKDDPRPPESLTVAGGGTTGSDRLTDVYQRLGSMQSSITYLEGHADDSRKKLDSMATDIISAKATFRTLKVVFGVVGSVLVLVWSFIATVLTMIAKHYLHW